MLTELWMRRSIQMNYLHSSPAGAYRPDLIRIQYRSAFLMLMFQLYKKCEKGLRMGEVGGSWCHIYGQQDAITWKAQLHIFEEITVVSYLLSQS